MCKRAEPQQETKINSSLAECGSLICVRPAEFSELRARPGLVFLHGSSDLSLANAYLASFPYLTACSEITEDDHRQKNGWKCGRHWSSFRGRGFAICVAGATPKWRQSI